MVYWVGTSAARRLSGPEAAWTGETTGQVRILHLSHPSRNPRQLGVSARKWDFLQSFKNLAMNKAKRLSADGEESKLASARRVVAECFWGDYLLSAEDILAGLERDEPGFARFIFSKIIENSRHPSRHLPILFPPEVLAPMLQRYLKMAGGKRRIRLVAANLTGRHELVPELQWKR